MNRHIFIILIILVIISCSNEKQEPRNNVYRPEFDISADNRNIVCSFYENNVAGIYQVDITNSQKTKISPTTERSLIRPLYSPDNKQIACLSESSTDDLKSQICLIDIASKTITSLTSDSLLILECIFDPNGKSLFFTAAGYFGNYSPIARKAAHKIDIYKVSIDTKEIEKLTAFNSYDLHGLSITNDGDSLLFRLTSDKSGLFLMDVETKGMSQITAANDLRAEKKLTAYEYYAPVLSNDNSKIVFTEPYELYIMDRHSKISQLIFRNEPILVNIGDAKFFYSYNYLMVSLPTNSKLPNSTGYNFGFYTLNPETKQLKNLDL